MWYAVTKNEIKAAIDGKVQTVHAGRVYMITPTRDETVLCTPLHHGVPNRAFDVTKEVLRKGFTLPTENVEEAMEQSFMQCEAVYG